MSLVLMKGVKEVQIEEEEGRRGDEVEEEVHGDMMGGGGGVMEGRRNTELYRGRDEGCMEKEGWRMMEGVRREELTVPFLLQLHPIETQNLAAPIFTLS